MFKWMKHTSFFSRIFKISDLDKELYIRGQKYYFSTIKSLDPKTKDLLMPKLDVFIQEEANINFWINESVADIVLSCTFVTYILSALFAPIFISKMHDIYPSFGGWIGIYILHILLSALLVMSIIATGGKKGLGRSLRVSSIVTILLFTLMQYLPQILNINSNNVLSFFYHLFASILTGILFIFILGGIIFIVGLWLVANLKQRKESLFPIAIVVERLSDTLIGLEKYSNRWTELEFRRDLINRLGKVARLIEFSVPKQLECSDDYINRWSKQSFKKIAATFRSLNKWVITPQQKTYDDLMALLARYLELIILGRWGEINQTELEQITLTKKGWAILRGILSGTIVGLVPLLVILIAQGIGVEIEKNVFDYLKIGAIIWAVLSIASTLDPQFKDKVGYFKDLTSSYGNLLK